MHILSFPRLRIISFYVIMVCSTHAHSLDFFAGGTISQTNIKLANSSGEVLTEFNTDYHFSPILGLVTEAKKIDGPDGIMEYDVEFSYESVKLSQTNLFNKEISNAINKPEINGYNLYAVPSVRLKVNDDVFVGLGLGLGYTALRGNYLYSDTTTETKSMHINKWSTAGGISIEIVNNNHTFSISNFGPIDMIFGTDMEGFGRVLYDISNFKLSYSYTFK